MKKTTKSILILCLIFLVSQKICATTNYVSLNGGHISPFDSWSKAATNIQFAIYLSSPGDTVLISNGVYYPRRGICITKDIVIKSLAGAKNTIIDGRKTNNCAYVSEGKIDGFTITNGYGFNGGGVSCDYNGIVENCIIVNNSAKFNGGGVNCHKGTILNCIINNNSASDDAGISCWEDSKILNCTINGNSARLLGGGIGCHRNGIVDNCIISKNSAKQGGGVIFKGTIQNCMIYENIAEFGGGVNCQSNGIIQNCIISKNSATCSGGGVKCFKNGIVQSCTIVGNSVSDGYKYRSKGGMIRNSIFWNNINEVDFIFNCQNLYNCIENCTNFTNGIITNNPQFISKNNFHLQKISPCKNSGTNAQYVFDILDLDNNPRKMGKVVDIGAYEYIETIEN